MNEEITCQDCGTTKDVDEVICPFAHEIYGEENLALLCPNCYHERCMDI